MADENGPIRGDASDLEAAADRLLAKARNAQPAIDKATRTVKEATSETREASGNADALNAEIDRLTRERQNLVSKRNRAVKNLNAADKRLFNSDIPVQRDLSDSSLDRRQSRMKATYDRNDRLVDKLGSQLDDVERRIADTKAQIAQAQRAPATPAPAPKAPTPRAPRTRTPPAPPTPPRQPPAQTSATQRYIEAQERADAIKYAARQPVRYDNPTVVKAQRQRLIDQYQLSDADFTKEGRKAAAAAAQQARAAAVRSEGLQATLPGMVGTAGDIPKLRPASKPGLGTAAFKRGIDNLRKVQSVQLTLNEVYENALNTGLTGKELTAEVDRQTELARLEAQRQGNARRAVKAKPAPAPVPAPQPAAAIAEPATPAPAAQRFIARPHPGGGGSYQVYDTETDQPAFRKTGRGAKARFFNREHVAQDFAQALNEGAPQDNKTVLERRAYAIKRAREKAAAAQGKAADAVERASQQTEQEANTVTRAASAPRVTPNLEQYSEPIGPPTGALGPRRVMPPREVAPETRPFKISKFLAGDASGSDISNPRSNSGYDLGLSRELERAGIKGGTLHLSVDGLRDLAEFSDTMAIGHRESGNPSGARSAQQHAERARALADQMAGPTTPAAEQARAARAEATAMEAQAEEAKRATQRAYQGMREDAPRRMTRAASEFNAGGAMMQPHAESEIRANPFQYQAPIGPQNRPAPVGSDAGEALKAAGERLKRAARAEEDAIAAMPEVEGELREAKELRRKLTEQQRTVLDRIADRPGTTGQIPGITDAAATQRSLLKRGLIEGTPGADVRLSDEGKRYDLTGAIGDLDSHQKYIERLQEESKRASQDFVHQYGRAKAAGQLPINPTPDQYATPIGPRRPPVPVTVKRPAAPSAARDIRPPVGDMDEFERALDKRMGAFADALDDGQRAELARRQQPTPEAERPAAQERVTKAKEQLADAVDEQTAQTKADTRKQAGAPPKKPPAQPPAPPTPPGPPEPPRRAYQGVQDDAMQRSARAAGRYATAVDARAKAAEQEAFDEKVARKVAQDAERERVAAEAKRIRAEQKAADEAEADARRGQDLRDRRAYQGVSPAYKPGGTLPEPKTFYRGVTPDRTAPAVTPKITPQAELDRIREQEAFDAKVANKVSKDSERERVAAEAKRLRAEQKAALEAEERARLEAARRSLTEQQLLEQRAVPSYISHPQQVQPWAQPGQLEGLPQGQLPAYLRQQQRLAGMPGYATLPQGPLPPWMRNAGRFTTMGIPEVPFDPHDLALNEDARIRARMESSRRFVQASRTDPSYNIPSYIEKGVQPSKARFKAQQDAVAKRGAQAVPNNREVGRAESDLEALAQQVEANERFQSTYNQRVSEGERAMARYTTQVGYSSQALRRHGTFTTEFIDAAAKGEASYREWGWQIGAAAAKFGAWTVAGAGVYAAINAVSKIGQGAVQSASGVESLKRTLGDVNSAQAQGSFRDQAAHFNVPIETVVDAQTRMGAVFHDQATAAKAAEAALYALQTGQVSVEDSTKSLISIQQGFGASAEDLTNLFDQLNYVQNNYGARIPDLLTGIGSVAGAFRQMNGTTTDAVALFTTLQRFGVSGNVARTIIGRIPNELAKPGNRTALQGFGIDPDQDFNALFAQAAQVVAQGADAQQVAAAIVGKQFAPRFLNALVNYPLYREIHGKLDSGAAKGASETELGHVLARFDERIKAIGIEFANLGSNIAQSGLLNVLGAGVEALHTMLSITNSLLGVFNQLPGPLKTAGVAVGLIAAGLAGARRLGLGEAFAGRGGGIGDRIAPYLTEDPVRRARRSGRKGINNAAKEATDENERAQTAALNAVREEEVTRAQSQRVRAKVEKQLAAAEPEITPEAAALAVARADQREIAAIEKREAAELRAAIALDRTAATRRTQREFNEAGNVGFGRGRLRRRDEAQVAAAIAAGAMAPPSGRLDVPGDERVESLAENLANAESQRAFAQRARPYLPSGAYDPNAGTTVAPPARGVRAANAAEDIFGGAAEALDGALGQGQRAQLESKRFSDKLGSVRESLGTQARTFRALKQRQGLLAATGALGTHAANDLAAAAAPAAASAGRFASAAWALIGPEGLFIAALTALPSVYEAIKGRYDALEATNKLVANPGDISKANIDKVKSEVLARQKEANSLIGQAKRTFIDPVVIVFRAAQATAGAANDALDSIGDALSGLTGGDANARGKAKKAADAARKAGQPAKPSGPGFFKRTFVERLPLVGPLVRTSDDIEYERQLKDYRAQQNLAATAKHAEATRKAGGSSVGLKGDDIGVLARRDVDDFKAGRLSPAEYQKHVQARLKEVESGFENGKKIDKNRQAYLTRRLKELLEQSADVEQATVDEIDARYNLLLSQTDDPTAQASLKVQQATEKLGAAQQTGDQNAINNALADLNNAQRDAQKAVEDQAQARVEALGALADAGIGGTGTIASYTAALRGEIAKLQGSSDPADMQKLAQAQGQLRSTIEGAGKQALDDALANARTPADIDKAYRNYERAGRAAIGSGKTTAVDPSDRTSPEFGTLRSLGAGATNLTRTTGAGTERAQLSGADRAAQRRRQQEVFEAYRARAEAQSAYTAGGLGGGVAAAKVALNTASEILKRGMRVYAKGSVELLGLMQNQQQASTAVAQEQLALIQAKGQVAVAGVTDPVAQGQGNIANLEQQLAFMRARPKDFGKEGDSQAIQQTIAQLKDARSSLADAVRQQAQDLLDADYALKESLTDDPVVIARLESEKAAKTLARGGFKNAAEKKTAQANANTALRASREAALDAKLSDIDFDVEIGRITTAEQIRKYEELLRTSKVGTQRKKELKQQIERLKHDAEKADDGTFELGLDNIRIPTMYEVARLVKGGQTGVTQAVNNANTVNVTVNGPQDYEELGRVLEQHVAGSGKATARAAQMR